MFEQLSKKQLIAVLVFLGFVIVVIKYFDVTKVVKKNLQYNQINIDTSRITAIYFYPQSNKENEIAIFKDEKDKRWELIRKNDSTGSPINNSIKGEFFRELHKLSNDSVISNEQNKWTQHKLDSNGVNILLVYDFEKRAIDFIAARTAIEGSVFIRVKGEGRVYYAKSRILDLLSPDIYTQSEKYFSVPFKDWKQLSFKLPTFDSYTLIKKKGEWYLGDSIVLQEKVETYYKQIEQTADTLNCRFKNLGNANNDFQLVVNSSDTIQGYATGKNVILANNKFSEKFCSSFQLFEKVFVSKEYWIQNNIH